MSGTMPSKAELALEERDRLYRQYRKATAAHFRELYADPQHGEALREFDAALLRCGPDDAERMIQIVRDATWLASAPADIRHAALRLVGFQIRDIRTRLKLPPFDDPLPDQPPDVFQTCKAMIEARA